MGTNRAYLTPECGPARAQTGSSANAVPRGRRPSGHAPPPGPEPPRRNRTTLSNSIRSDLPGAALAVADPDAVRANKLDLLERLADALAHEIKNPLHSMVINLEVLKRRLARAPAEGNDVMRYATVLGEELDRVSRRIELLLRLSRPDRAGADDTTLNELVEEVMELVSLEARHREARVEYDPARQMARVHVGRQHARQIILNLVLDVLDGLAGGDTLHVDIQSGPDRAVLTVSGGASSEGGERLAVAAALAEAVGGRVDVHGTTRTLSLPAHGIQ
jgi:signal transduction histidine kinase